MKLPNLFNAAHDEAGHALNERTRPMTKTETSIFIACELMKPKPAPVPAAELPDAVKALDIFKLEMFEGWFTGQVLLKRLQLTDGLYDPCMVALAMVMSDRPGVSVLWAYTLYARALELGHPYTIDDFTRDFPMGPPTSDAASEVWDQQKKERDDKDDGVLGFPTDNLLDTPAPWRVHQKEQADA